MRALVVLKLSKWERDLTEYGSVEAVQELYRAQNNAYDKVYSSHVRQTEARDALRTALPRASFIQRDELPDLDLSRFDCVISLGGDNFFIFVSCYLEPDMPLLGINSDPWTSQGALLYFTAREFADRLLAGETRMVTEEWTRISCELEYLDGRKIKAPPSASEISFQNRFPDHVSRYLIRRNEEEWEEQKSSGLLFSTGAGSTGWFRNCHWGHKQNDAVFPKDAPCFRFIARELSATKKYRYQLSQCETGDVVELISEMDGTVSIDTHPEFTYEFPAGCRARIRISESSLKVVRDLALPAIGPPEITST